MFAINNTCKHLEKIGTGHLGYPFPPNVHLPQVPICPSAHLHIFLGNGHRALGVPLFPKCPFVPSAHLPQCPFVNIWGKRAEGTCGTPLGHLGYPFSPNVHCLGAYLLQCPFPPVPNSPNIYFPQIPISPNIHLPQIVIFPKCQFAPSSHLLTSPPFSRDPFVRNTIVWDPFVRDPFVLESFNLHLFALLSQIQKQKVFGYRQVAQLKLLRHCLAQKLSIVETVA